MTSVSCCSFNAGASFQALRQLASGCSEETLLLPSECAITSELGRYEHVGIPKLYMKPKDSSKKLLDVSQTPGIPTLELLEIDKCAVPASTATPGAEALVARTNTLRGAPLDDGKLRRKLLRQKRKEFLSDWFGMRRSEMTHEIWRELKVFELRGYAYGDKFLKKSVFNGKELPKYFHMAREIPDGLSHGVGEHSTMATDYITKKKGTSLVTELLRDTKSKAWLTRRSAETQAFEASGNRNWYRRMHKRRKRFIARRIPRKGR